MENENIGIYGLLEMIDNGEDYEIFVIKDFLVVNAYEDKNMVEVLTGDYCYQFLPTIENNKVSKNVCTFRVLYEQNEGYINLSINDVLSSLRQQLCDAYVVCRYEDGVLKNIYATSEYNEDILTDIPESEDEYDNKREFLFRENEINLSDISNNVKKAIINQDEVVDKTLANIVYNQKLYFSNFPLEKARLLKKNMLIFGKTGTGKTEVIKQIVDNLSYDIPYVIEDASSYTIDGYKGKDVIDMLRRLVVEADYDVDEAEHGILVIDEIDKKIPHGEGSDIASTGVQQALLKIIEGGDFDLSTDKMPEFSGMVINTSLISVILLGHFDGIYKESKKNVIGFASNDSEQNYDYKPEDFIKLGMIPEFMGRINDIVKTNDIDVDTIKKIISKSSISPIALEKEFYKELGVKLSFDDDFITTLAQKSLDKGTGARGIKSSYDEMMGNLNFEVLSGIIEEVSFEKGKVRKKGVNKESL